MNERRKTYFTLTAAMAGLLYQSCPPVRGEKVVHRYEGSSMRIIQTENVFSPDSYRWEITDAEGRLTSKSEKLFSLSLAKELAEKRLRAKN